MSVFRLLPENSTVLVLPKRVFGDLRLSRGTVFSCPAFGVSTWSLSSCRFVFAFFSVNFKKKKKKKNNNNSGTTKRTKNERKMGEKDRQKAGKVSSEKAGKAT